MGRGAAQGENGIWTRLNSVWTNHRRDRSINGKNDPFPDATIYDSRVILVVVFRRWTRRPSSTLKTKPVAFVSQLLNSPWSFRRKRVWLSVIVERISAQRAEEKLVPVFLSLRHVDVRLSNGDELKRNRIAGVLEYLNSIICHLCIIRRKCNLKSTRVI